MFSIQNIKYLNSCNINAYILLIKYSKFITSIDTNTRILRVHTHILLTSNFKREINIIIDANEKRKKRV